MTTKYRDEINYTHHLHDRQNEHHRNRRILLCLDKHGYTTIDSVGRSTYKLDMPQTICARCECHTTCNKVAFALERNTY